MQTILIIIMWLAVVLFAWDGFKDTRRNGSEDPQEPRQEPPREPEPEPQQVDREKLIKIAYNCLVYKGCKFNILLYLQDKTDTELMDIITQCNINE